MYHPRRGDASAERTQLSGEFCWLVHLELAAKPDQPTGVPLEGAGVAVQPTGLIADRARSAEAGPLNHSG